MFVRLPASSPTLTRFEGEYVERRSPSWKLSEILARHLLLPPQERLLGTDKLAKLGTGQRKAGSPARVEGHLLGHQRASTTNRDVHLDYATLSEVAEQAATSVQRKLRTMVRWYERKEKLFPR